MFANCQGGGVDICFPEICKTPPAGAPLPYPNVAMGCSAVGFYPRVILQTGPAHTLATTIPMTSGDEIGAMGGAVSLIIKGPSRHTAGSCLLYTSPSPRDRTRSRMPSSA